MPPRAKKRRADTELSCNFGECQATIVGIDAFMEHVGQHQETMATQLAALALRMADQSDVDLTVCECPWRQCDQVLPHANNWDACLIHLSLHANHTFAKARGDEIVERRKGTAACQGTDKPVNSLPVPEKALSCEWANCTHTFVNIWKYYRHMDDHLQYPLGENDVWICCWKDCGTECSTKARLNEHIRKHTAERPYACSQCGNYYSGYTKLADHHIRQLSEDTIQHQYQCSHCYKKFNGERLLRDHLRRHVNLYGCMFCDMTCQTPSALQAHILYRHTDQRPHKCPHCHKAYKRTYDVARHMLIHKFDGMEYGCPYEECKFTSSTHSILMSHVRKHVKSMESRSYQCHLCQEDFTEPNVISNHLRSVHELELPSGHMRFRYSMNEDGVYRLVTMRFERIGESSGNLEVSPSEHDDEITQESTNQTPA